jgi:TrmH family RNA methyltransferase
MELDVGVLSSIAGRPPLKMDIVSITSSRNPILAQIRELRRPSERQRQGKILIEGTHQVAEAVAAGWPLSAVLSTQEWLDKNPEIAARMPREVRRFTLPEELLRRVATTDSPDGVVAIGQRVAKDCEPTFEELRLSVLLDGVQDPGNMGNIVRCAAAVGAAQVFATSESVSIDHPKVIRASAGQWFRHPPRCIEAEALFAHCHSKGVRILGATAGATPYWDLDLSGPILLVLGSEGAGLSRSVLEKADTLVSVPMSAGVESLNVALCGGLILYEALRQRTVQSL